jgi:type II secretory pathway predicted ATPase ExeA
MLALKPLLQQHGISQAELARAVNLSPAAIAQLLNKEIWPASPTRDALQASLTAELAARDIAVTTAHFEPVSVAAETEKQTEHPLEEDRDMLLEKKRLSQQAKKQFGLIRDPFDNEIHDEADVFLSKDARTVREAMRSTARFGGFMAIVGESGAGKTTLLEDLEEHLMREKSPVMIIKPTVAGMEQDDVKGKRLKAASILDAILRRVDPDCGRRGLTLEEKGCRTHEALLRSYQNGYRHCLIIEEAHRLAVPTLRHLKGFHEMKLGRQPLLSILLLGQPELAERLHPKNYGLREVIQRCQVVTLAPLDADLDGYVRHKLERVGSAFDKVFESNALDGIRARLIASKGNGQQRETFSLMYPLMVNNLLTAAMNNAGELGFAKVTADVIKEAR